MSRRKRRVTVATVESNESTTPRRRPGFQPGQSGNPKGRKAGVPNRFTRDIKEGFRILVEDNIENFEKWIKRLAKKDPGKAMDMMMKMSEYLLPKLGRTEHVGSVEIVKTTTEMTEEQILERLGTIQRGAAADRALSEEEGPQELN